MGQGPCVDGSGLARAFFVAQQWSKYTHRLAAFVILEDARRAAYLLSSPIFLTKVRVTSCSLATASPRPNWSASSAR
jgi:hypothetical protein